MGEVVLEKDFWVCWTLRELFALPGIGEHLIFKGGTSLSKVWRAIARFSEDIDVSLSREWLGFTGDRSPEHVSSEKKQRERMADLAAACSRKIATEILPALRARAAATLGDQGWAIAVDPEDSQTLRFTYPSDVSAAMPDTYVRREVKIEFGARSDDWPAEDKSVVPYVAELYPQALADAVAPLRVLSLERVFFAAAWAKYETAIPGTFRLIPPAYRLAALESDYRDMQEMFFGRSTPWSAIVEELRNLEARINRHGG